MQKTGQQMAVWKFVLTGVVVAILAIVGRGWHVALAGDGVPDNGLHLRGIVSGIPNSGLTGEWVIDGKTFTADGATDFNQEDGSLAIGVCADVDYVVEGNVNRALAIDSKLAAECEENATVTPDPEETPDPNATPEPGETEEPTDTPSDHDGDGELEVHGNVTGMPTDVLTGTWSVDDVDYLANADTEFEQEYGPFELGACVQVEYVEDGGQLIATEIKTDKSFHCDLMDTGEGVASEGELYGVIESFPDTLTGTWTISGMAFEANLDTEFNQDDVAFKVGVTVQVHFTTDANGVNHAQEIETKFAGEDGEDEDGNGSVDGADGQAFALVDEFPAGLIGPWIIGGVVYTATADIEFETEHGDFAVGVRVKVEFFEGSDGNLYAGKIETTNDNGETEAVDHSKFVGYVDSAPEISFLGPWQIGGKAFLGDANTEFEEEDCVLAQDAYVKVEYFDQNGQQVIHKLECAVPPGAGDDDQIGEIEDVGDDNSGAHVSGAAVTWTVGGVPYVVTSATKLDEHNGPLQVGAGAMVNSFVDANGAHVATSIRGIGEVYEVFLPSTIR